MAGAAPGESAYDPHPIIPQPQGLGAWNPPMSRGEAEGDMYNSIARAALMKAIQQNPNLFIQLLTGRT